ncbi:MAG: Crp/Fnr family transcriptional regulator [Clostridiales bacterium]|nr:Crp/Fnr family transcriptional regulator [Clostridiales bacterium]
MLEIARITTEKSYLKGEHIYLSGDKGNKLYVIHSGKVKISRISPSGKEQVIRVLGAGDFMGELSLFSESTFTDNSEVMEDTTLCLIEGHHIKNLMAKYPTIAFKVLEELSKRLDAAENLIENISIHSVEKRLADTLLNLANREGEVHLPMRKQDLASSLGMSQETLSRKLSSFQQMGLIQLIGHRRIILLDINSLEEIE